MSRETILATAEQLGLVLQWQFVPHSMSRDAGARDPSLHWRVKVLKGSAVVLTTDYSAGCAHCPSYKQRPTVAEWNMVKQECESGRKHPFGPMIEPNPADIFASLASDSDALNYASFEQWAKGLDFDPDSRKAESIYRACLGIGLALRAAVGEEGLCSLREAARDY